MNLEVRLIKYDWYHEQGVSVTGYAWLQGRYVSGNELTRNIQKIKVKLHTE